MPQMRVEETGDRARLRSWAGDAVYQRGQAYQQRGHVHDLAMSESGDLVAWVQGTSRYATRMRIGQQQFESDCSCPYGVACKHAVAVALAYLMRPKQALPLPVVGTHDARLVRLDRLAAPWSPTIEASGDPALEAFLGNLSHDELVTLMLELTQRFPEVRDALAVRQMLTTEDIGQLEADLSRRIAAACALSDWDDDWEDRDSPDFGPIRDGLQRLLDQGYADAIVQLGEQLLEAGMEQADQSHDEGETLTEIGSCLALVFTALPRSTLAPDEQLRFTIDALLRDPYDLCYGAQQVLAYPYPPEAWSVLANELLAQIATFAPVGGSFTRSYERERKANYAILALEKAGRTAEIIPLCEREAQYTHSYQRLVDRLIADGRTAEAEQWARSGVVATEQQALGLAARLIETMIRLQAEAGDWAMVAALHARDFFYGPTLAGVQALLAAADKAQVATAVRAAAQHYLETGQLLQAAHAALPPWPLPDTGLPRRVRTHPIQFPHVPMLIALAISERRPAEVLRWYDAPRTGQLVPISHDQVADAVADTYPERAAQIWQRLAEGCIAQTTPSAYIEAAKYLRKLRRMWAGEAQTAAWHAYVVGLREANRRKRRLVETLDQLLSGG